MTRLRLAVLLLAACASLTAAAQTTFEFGNYHLDEYFNTVAVQASAPVKSLIHVHYSYEFPSFGISESGTLAFEPGDQQQTFRLQFPTDAYYPRLHGTATISYGETTKTKQLSIEYFEPYLTIDEARVAESADEQSVTFRLSRPSAVPITLNVTTADGSAKAGVDFGILDDTVTFPPRVTEQLVRFTAGADGLAEGEETFTIYGQSGLFSEPPFVSGRGAMITIADAEIGSTLDPAASDVFSGDTLDLGLTLTRPLHATKAVTIAIASSNRDVAKPRLDAMVVPAGVTSLSIPITTDLTGEATITITFPDETAASPATAEVHVYGGEFSFEVPQVLLRKREQMTIGVRLSPPPPSPREVGIELSRSGVVVVQGSAYLGSDGTGSFTFSGTGLGTVDLSIVNGQGNVLATMTARVIDTFAAKSIAPAKGSAAGGTPVTITGTGLGGTCTVLFNGVPATSVTVVDEQTIRATTPAHAAGTVDVKVGCDSFIQPLPAAFTFNASSRGRAVRH